MMGSKLIMSVVNIDFGLSIKYKYSLYRLWAVYYLIRSKVHTNNGPFSGYVHYL